MKKLFVSFGVVLYEQGAELELDEPARQKRQKFRQLVAKKQSQMLPAMRDAYGSIMRRKLWEVDVSARTIGAGYRTIELVSVLFARNANIKQIHLEIVESLRVLRFTRAQYKWIREASEFSYYSMVVPKDTELVIWDAGIIFKVLE